MSVRHGRADIVVLAEPISPHCYEGPYSGSTLLGQARVEIEGAP